MNLPPFGDTEAQQKRNLTTLIGGSAASDLRKIIGKRGLEVVDDHAEIIQEIQMWARTQVIPELRVLRAEVDDLLRFKAHVVKVMGWDAAPDVPTSEPQPDATGHS